MERPEEFAPTFAELQKNRPEALIVSSSALFFVHRARLIEFAAKHRLPTIYHQSEFLVGSGGLMSYGPDFHYLARRSATYVDKILRGVKPGDLPVEQPTKAASLARPGGRVTGSAVQFEDLVTKQLQILKEMVPKVVRVAILAHTSSVVNPNVVNPNLKAAETAARALDLKGRVFEIRTALDVEAAFQTAKAERADGVHVLPSPAFSGQRKRLAELAAKHRLPAIYEDKGYVDAGGLMSYGPNFPGLYRRAATYVDRILKGARPSDLPIEQPAMFELAINLKAAKAVGLEIPQSLLLRADHVIK